MKAAPQMGTRLHKHTTVEVFVPLAERWAIFHGTGPGRVDGLSAVREAARARGFDFDTRCKIVERAAQ